MRVALVQCPPWGSLPPLGLASLKPYVEAHGHAVRCFDLNIDYCRERLDELLDDVGGSVYARPDPWVSGSFDEWAFEFDGEVRFTSTLKDRPLPIERWADAVLAADPQVVGFSVQSTNLGVTLQLAQHLAGRRPSVSIVFGGPNVAEAQEGKLALRTGVPDVVVEGEGEATFVDLLEALELGRDLDEVEGIGRLVGGRPTWTDRRPLLKDVDVLPFPDFTDFDWTNYPNPYEIPIMTSRGCVLNCAFCYETVYWKRFRTQSANRIVAEIEHQLATHPLRADAEAGTARFGMSFADSLVNGHLGGLRRMAEMLIANGTDIYWNGQATINTKMDDDFFQKLAASGCSGLSFGLESGSASVLESMGKRFDIHEATDFFRRVAKVDIELVVNVMVGFPTETRADFIQTLRFLAKIRRMIFMVNNVSPTAIVGGSRLQESPDQFGVTPVSIAGWEAREDFRWVSDAAGDERNRERRLKVLHVWMTLLRIPHQRIGPPRFDLAKVAAVARRVGGGAHRKATEDRPRRVRHRRSAPLVAPATRARGHIRRLSRGQPGQPLVIEARHAKVARLASRPTWAAALDVEGWIGCPLLAIPERLTPLLGEAVMSERRLPDGTLEVSVASSDPSAAGLAGLTVFVLPEVEDRASQVLVLFPLVVDRPSVLDRT